MRSAGRGATGALNPFDQSGRRRRGQSLREQEEEPYIYDSNGRQLMIIKVVLALWVAIAIATAVGDYLERDVLAKWHDAGFLTVPDDRDVEGVLEFAALHGIDCSAAPGTGDVPARCGQAFDFAREIDDAETLVFGLFSGYLFLFVALAVLIASFAYQANRNLLTLKTDGQRFSAVSAMLWLFVPLINFYKGNQIFQEIWKGSDPDHGEGEGWKSASRSGHVTLWWITFAITVLLGPRTIRWLFGSSQIGDQLDVAWGVILTDLFLAVPAIFAYIALTAIHERQEKKHEIVGYHVAVPRVRGLSLD